MSNGDDPIKPTATSVSPGIDLKEQSEEYAAQQKIIRENAELTQKRVEAEEKLVALQAKQIKNDEDLAEIQKLLVTIAEQNQKIRANDQMLAERSLALAQQTLEALKAENAELLRSADYRALLAKAEEDVTSATVERLKAELKVAQAARAAAVASGTEDEIENQGILIDSLLTQIETQQTNLRFQQQNTRSLEQQGDALKDYVGDIGSALDMNGQLYAMQSVQGVNALTQLAGATKTQRSEMAKSLLIRAKTVGPMLAIGLLEKATTKVLNAAINLTSALDQQRAALMKNTGASKAMAGEFMSTMTEMAAFGVTAETAAQSFGALFDKFSEFTMVSGRDRKKLLDTVAVLELHGVAATDAAEGLELATKALGMSTKKATELQLRIAAFAKDLGRAPGEVAKEFAQVAPVLSKLTVGVEQSFKNLQGTIKATGLEMNTIIGIAESFDTFAGATDQVGRLNAMLGGDFLGVMQMMETEDPAERFKLITDAVHDAGFAFESMTYYEKIAIKEAMGLKSVDEVAKALSGDFESLGIATEKSAASMEAMRQRGQANLSLQQKFQALLTALTPTFIEVADVIGGAVDALADFVTENREAIEFVGGGIALLGTFATILGVVKVAIMGVAFALGMANLSGGALLGVVSAIVMGLGALHRAFKRRRSPTILENINLMSESFKRSSQNIGQATGKVKDLTSEVPRLNASIKAAGPETQAVVAPNERAATTDSPFKTAAREFLGTGGGGNTQVNVYIGEQKLNEMITKVVHRQLNPAKT